MRPLMSLDDGWINFALRQFFFWLAVGYVIQLALGTVALVVWPG
jgi:hypothetical protein